MAANITYIHKSALQPADHRPPLHTATPPIVNLDLHECFMIVQKPSKNGLVITETTKTTPGRCLLACAISSPKNASHDMKRVWICAGGHVHSWLLQRKNDH